MPRLDLAKTVDTPAVEFNPETGIFCIEGESYPENAMEFYRPVIECLNEFVSQSHQSLEVNLKMLYFNSSSSKCLLDIFDILEEYAGKGDRKVKVNWYFQEDDEDIKESGEDFAEDLNLEFQLIPYT